ncbi:histone-lysine N-methyltransferase SETMAR [Trichonephila clavipes]|nr:histone-lysine N-methyltransferase SETMAR [Trichonephila clavipes]
MAVVSISRHVSIKQFQIYARCQGDIHTKEIIWLFLVLSVVIYRVLKMEVNKEKIRYILQFFFDKGENASQAAEIVNGLYGADTVTANYAKFWFRRLHSGIFDVKDAPRVGRPVVKNVDKISEIIGVDRHISNRSLA